ncbi:MAG: molybdate ABC transporter substrate-binding protein [Rhodocyclaceae bacterium]|jgi:molybdate transport system substrate-binding protein|nr:molybdate ABC transporter substrate-binding protein [Rhodocyclaceae bacterium]
MLVTLHVRLLAWIALFLTALPVSALASGEVVTAAVAANFTKTIEEIGARFTEETGHTIRFSSGPSGKLYAQIRNGAPFDLFFSADTEKPELLAAEGRADTPFVYARGRLALYSPDLPVREGWQQVLEEAGFRHLAIANPRTAPYGAAALEVLTSLGALERVEPKFVQGESIAHAFQFVATGNAALGFVALSQLVDPAGPVFGKGEFWLVPEDLHSPIDQAAVVLERGRASPAALAFMDYMRSPRAREIIERYGYSIP